MPSKIFRPEDIPKGTEWVYKLNAGDAITQCRILGLESASTLSGNRVVLGEFVSKLKVNGGDDDPPCNHYPEAHFGADGQENGNLGKIDERFENTAPVLDTVVNPAGTDQVLNARVPVSTLTAAPTPNTGSPSSSEPSWRDLIQATATAVGTSIAQAIAQSAGSRSASQAMDSLQSNNCPKVLSDMITGVSQASGSDPKSLIMFLIQVQKLNNLHLANEFAVIVALLPRTLGQLRTTWAQAIAEKISLSTLIGQVLNYFVPHRLRHSLITELVFRKQRGNESIADFVTDLQDVSTLIMSDISPSELLEVVLTGMNEHTRAHLSGFPAPTCIQDLLAMAPRIEVMRRLASPSATSNPLPQQNREPRRFGYTQNRQTNFAPGPQHWQSQYQGQPSHQTDQFVPNRHRDFSGYPQGEPYQHRDFNRVFPGPQQYPQQGFPRQAPAFANRGRAFQNQTGDGHFQSNGRGRSNQREQHFHSRAGQSGSNAPAQLNPNGG